MGTLSLPSVRGYSSDIYDVTCETLAGQCHGEGTGNREGYGEEFALTFWHGSLIHFTKWRWNFNERTMYLRYGRRHGPEFWRYGDKHYRNRMWTFNNQSGDREFKPEEGFGETAAFFDINGEPNWPALYNWCDYVPNNSWSNPYARFGNTCTYDPEVDSLTKSKY